MVQGPNEYLYVRSTPVLFSDPSGRSSFLTNPIIFISSPDGVGCVLNVTPDQERRRRPDCAWIAFDPAPAAPCSTISRKPHQDGDELASAAVVDAKTEPASLTEAAESRALTPRTVSGGDRES